MSVLHQYRWHNENHFAKRIHLLRTGDSLVIYGCPQHLNPNRFLDPLVHLKIPIYWLSQKSAHNQNSPMHPIDYDQWLTLIEQHDKTHTWK